jgi:hypothetical protein
VQCASRSCHTRLSEENQVHTYMHARIKFHAYSDIKVNTETVSRKEKGRLSEYYALSWKRRLQTSQAIDWGLRTPSTSNIFIAASSFWATMFIARVSTCRTQQVWKKIWMQRLYSGLGYKHLSNFSWSNFISTWLLIKYKFIPTHIKHKIRGMP